MRWGWFWVESRRRRVEEDGGGLVRDGEGFEGGEGGEGGAGDAEGAAVVGMSGGQVMASVNGFFHEAAPLLAPPHCVFIVELRGRTTHDSLTKQNSQLSLRHSELKPRNLGYGVFVWRAFGGGALILSSFYIFLF